MAYKAIFNGWKNISLQDLLVAYRKAKADCFFENIFPISCAFANYENDLIENLHKLLKNIKSEDGFENLEYLLGTPRILPKKLTLKELPPDFFESSCKNGHVHFSNPKREIENIKKYNDFVAEFRIVGDFPVDTHIISALWINMIGHKFDVLLSKSSYGSRLRRLRVEDNNSKSFHISSIGSFKPYFNQYQKWRKNGLKSIRDNLHNGNNVIAVSLDFKCFYHNIDPQFLSSDEFLKEIEIELSSEEKVFNLHMSDLLSKWSDKAIIFVKNLSKIHDAASNDNDTENGGLVVGLTASRIISNVLLHKWDKLIKEKITPIYYGRYVDDLFLVIQDPGNICDIEDLMKFLQNRIGDNHIKNGKGDLWEVYLGEYYQKKSQLQFQSNKQKLFVLEGQTGCDLLDSIEKEIHELSSEYRLMPVPDQLEQSTAARVLSASSTTRNQADTLRRADGLTIRRLSWSLQLRHIEMLAKDLPKKEWKNERAEFYEFAHNHILRPDRFFDHYIYLSRLLGFAIGMNDWDRVLNIVAQSFESIDFLQSLSLSRINKSIDINGCEFDDNVKVWQEIFVSLAKDFIESLSKYLNLRDFSNEKSPSDKINRIIFKISEKLDITYKGIYRDYIYLDIFKKSKRMLVSDLANIPYKDFLTKNFAKNLLKEFNIENENKILLEFEKTDLLKIEILKEFINNRKKEVHNLNVFSPYLFPTRPYTPEEIVNISPECIWPKKKEDKSPRAIWANYVQVLRGVWIKPSVLTEEDNYNNRMVKIGSSLKNKIVVAITSIYLSDEEWSHSACEKPLLTIQRYRKIAKLVNEAIHLTPRPDYLVFPELSIPIEWVASISNRLLKAGISLIAGTEYRHRNSKKIYSEACLSLVDDSLGYPAAIRIWQPKLQPAVGEEHTLISKYGKSWWSNKTCIKNPVYNHNNFYFGIMICSELQNSKARISYQGEIDSLIILAWNKDINTFSNLVESASLDIHAYIVMVNNRKYGDSRVRAPGKQEFKRDLVQLRGGENDFLVAVELDIDALRRFQSRAKRWAYDEDLFKPVPEGYVISKGRKKNPPN